MKKINLPGVSFPVSAVCLGTAYYGSRDSEELARQKLDHYYSCGGRFLNTAHEYGLGTSEEVIGRWLRDHKLRQEMVITTKGGEDLSRPRVMAMSRAELIEDIDESLVRLGMDYVDFFLLHIDDPEIPVAEIMDTLHDLKVAGKLLHYGCSNWSIERMVEAAAYADKKGIDRFVMHEIEWNLARSNRVNKDLHIKWLDDEYIAYHEKTKLAVGAYSPLAVGMFAKYARTGDFSGLTEWQQKAYASAYNARMAKKLQRLARETGFTISQLQIGYLCSQPRQFAVFPIVGSSSLAQLQESLAGVHCDFTREMLEFLEEEGE